MKSLVSKGLVMQSREDIINHERVNWEVYMLRTNCGGFFCKNTTS